MAFITDKYFLNALKDLVKLEHRAGITKYGEYHSEYERYAAMKEETEETVEEAMNLTSDLEDMWMTLRAHRGKEEIEICKRKLVETAYKVIAEVVQLIAVTDYKEE